MNRREFGFASLALLGGATLTTMSLLTGCGASTTAEQTKQSAEKKTAADSDKKDQKSGSGTRESGGGSGSR